MTSSTCAKNRTEEVSTSTGPIHKLPQDHAHHTQRLHAMKMSLYGVGFARGCDQVRTMIRGN